MAVSKKRGITCPNCGSQIVHRTELILKEKLKAYFIPTEMFRCQPCGTRFARYGNPFTHKKKRRLLYPLALIIILLVSFLSFILTGPREAPAEKITETNQNRQVNRTPQPQKEEKIVEETQKTPEPEIREQETGQETPRTKTGQETGAAPVNIIKLGDTNKFGVNWEYNGTGLEITRLSPGPLQRAGFKIGDVLISVNGEMPIDDTKILKLRNEIFAGIRQEAFIRAVRGEKKFFYKLVK